MPIDLRNYKKFDGTLAFCKFFKTELASQTNKTFPTFSYVRAPDNRFIMLEF